MGWGRHRASWEPELRELIIWFLEHEDDLPRRPFKIAYLSQQEADPAGTYEALKRRFDFGPWPGRDWDMKVYLTGLYEHWLFNGPAKEEAACVTSTVTGS